MRIVEFSAMKPLTKSEKEVLVLIGKKLREMRIKKGYKSYETFAFDNDINRMQYWRMEKGLSNMSMATLLRVMDVYKISLKDFFKDFS
jgi:transcriptional regulator with XRE-family HTH domain